MPIGLDGLAAAVARAERPLFAIGGLEPGDAGRILDAGAYGLAVQRGVFGASDPGAAVRLAVTALCSGDGIDAEVVVANLGAGHDLPTGPVGRALVLEVAVLEVTELIFQATLLVVLVLLNHLYTFR